MEEKERMLLSRGRASTGNLPPPVVCSLGPRSRALREPLPGETEGRPPEIEDIMNARRSQGGQSPQRGRERRKRPGNKQNQGGLADPRKVPRS